MRYFLPLVLATCLTGCVGTESEVILEGELETSQLTESGGAGVMTASYTAGEKATMSVPEMSCAIMCYPKVKATLEELDGIEAVELVEQQEEAVIDDRRVVVTFGADVSSDVAIAALKEAGFPDSSFE